MGKTFRSLHSIFSYNPLLPFAIKPNQRGYSVIFILPESTCLFQPLLPILNLIPRRTKKAIGIVSKPPFAKKTAKC
jgi:hypothetical protein